MGITKVFCLQVREYFCILWKKCCAQLTLGPEARKSHSEPSRSCGRRIGGGLHFSLQGKCIRDWCTRLWVLQPREQLDRDMSWFFFLYKLCKIIEQCRTEYFSADVEIRAYLLLTAVKWAFHKSTVLECFTGLSASELIPGRRFWWWFHD